MNRYKVWFKKLGNVNWKRVAGLIEADTGKDAVVRAARLLCKEGQPLTSVKGGFKFEKV